MCKISYALNSQTGKCVVCDGCQTCDSADPKKCTACFAPQVLNTDTNKCADVTCTINNCIQCDLTGAVCKSCLVGFSIQDGKCAACSVEGCKSCSTSVDVCDGGACDVGMIFSTKKNKCMHCGTGCKGCLKTDISACVGCSSGYY